MGFRLPRKSRQPFLYAITFTNHRVNIDNIINITIYLGGAGLCYIQIKKPKLHMSLFALKNLFQRKS